MNPVDPRHHLRANGAEPVTDAWYINTYTPRTSWSKEAIYRGFDLTPDEYIAANSLLMTLLKTNDLFELKGTGQERIVKLWPVIVKFEAECEFWGKGETSYGVEIPGWWKRGALDGWIEMAAQYMRKMRLPPLLPDPTPYRVWDPPPTEGGPTLPPMVEGRAMDICGEGDLLEGHLWENCETPLGKLMYGVSWVLRLKRTSSELRFLLFKMVEGRR